MTYLRRKKVSFMPVVLIPEVERTILDEAAVSHMYELHRIVGQTMDTERSRQQTIGISEVGSDCKKCVARKLSGEYVKVPDPSWKAQMGTFMHSGLEADFVRQFPWMFEWHSDVNKLVTRSDLSPTLEQPLYYLERKLTVWRYKDFVLAGSCDLFTRKLVEVNGVLVEIGIVTDWKSQGPPKLKLTSAGKVSDQYNGQMDLYGLGYQNDGFTPTHVDLHAIPRDGELDESRPVLRRWNKQNAIDLLAFLANLIDAAEIVGWEKVIDAQPRANPCYDCDSFASQDDDRFIAALTGGH